MGANYMENEQETREPAAGLVLHPDDNVVVCRRDVRAGEIIDFEGYSVIVRSDVALGHKIARRAIPAGSQVVKYGMSIGVSTADILPGDWVHLHNMRSDYIQSHTRQSVSRK
ncbi:MAG TPA: UxaA family hydrolase [Steroidobacteraceae bacterium]|nr:UxaA family hydrolase [Steroidobacteraceae bacterium]